MALAKQNLGLDLDTPTAIQTALSMAARFGFDDEFRGVKHVATGLEIIQAIGCSNWRMGHKRYLRSAYQAGRFSAQMTMEG